MAIYAIGDIHGNLKALTGIFDSGKIKSKDTVVFLGDYIDRGPDTKGVIDWLIDNQKKFNFKFILGNHELMMLASKVSPHKLIEWLYNGGAATLDSYKIDDDPKWMDKIPQNHWAFLDTCLPYLAIGKYIFVHAGLEQGKKLESQNTDHLFWNKYEIPEQYSPDLTVICGHTSRKNGKIADFGHTICIDTYAYGGMWLTCLNVETGEYLKANNSGEINQGTLERFANPK